MFAPSASWATLRARAALFARARRFFDTRGFLEVDTPALSADVVVDRHLDPLAVTVPDDPRRPAIGRQLWLQTSPEFHMKRLLAAGSGPIYQLCRVFRGGEKGRWHNPEFTMLEWYQPGASYRQGMDLLAELAGELLGGGATERISYREMFIAHAGIDPLRATVDDFIALARQRGIAPPGSLDAADRDGWLDWLLVELVEPKLAERGSTIVFDYPGSQAALAQTRVEADGAIVAERFELYVQGIELANGYHELLDADELARRNLAANGQRQRDGKGALPVDSRLLAAMRGGLPPAVGVALGLDRTLMIALGAGTVQEVMPFPIDIA